MYLGSISKLLLKFENKNWVSKSHKVGKGDVIYSYEPFFDREGVLHFRKFKRIKIVNKILQEKYIKLRSCLSVQLRGVESETKRKKRAS